MLTIPALSTKRPRPRERPMSRLRERIERARLAGLGHESIDRQVATLRHLRNLFWLALEVFRIGFAERLRPPLLKCPEPPEHPSHRSRAQAEDGVPISAAGAAIRGTSCRCVIVTTS
jgi:hypothetical protein